MRCRRLALSKFAAIKLLLLRADGHVYFVDVVFNLRETALCQGAAPKLEAP